MRSAVIRHARPVEVGAHPATLDPVRVPPPCFPSRPWGDAAPNRGPGRGTGCYHRAHMDVLTGVFEILALVIAVGGAAKIVAPAAFARTLRSLRVPGGVALARLSGVLEVAIGIGATILGGRIAALVVAATYAVFTVVVVAARRAGAESCGCFGAVAAPPSTVHVVVNAASAVLALAAAVVGPAALTDVLADQPLAGIPYLVTLGVGVWLTVVIDTTGAQLLEEMAAVRRLGPTYRENARTAAVPARTVARGTRSDQGRR